MLEVAVRSGKATARKNYLRLANIIIKLITTTMRCI